MPALDYYATFSRGDLVVIARRDVLEKYHRKHGYAYGVTDEQFAFAGEVAQVIQIGLYHGECVLYQLGHNRHHLEPPKALPGVWFEDCVNDHCFSIPESAGCPLASSHYEVDPEKRGEHWYLVVRDRNGTECLATLCFNQTDTEARAVLMRRIARRRDVFGFARKYGFIGTCDWRPDRRR